MFRSVSYMLMHFLFFLCFYSLFTSSIAFNRMFSRSADSEEGISHILRRDIVNRLRR